MAQSGSDGGPPEITQGRLGRAPIVASFLGVGDHALRVTNHPGWILLCRNRSGRGRLGSRAQIGT